MGTKFYLLLILFFIFISCESESERRQRLEMERQALIEEEIKVEKEKQEKAIYEKYVNNSLENGTTPYEYCYGKNNGCSNNGCSQIKVTSPINSDVIVTIKRDNETYRHAYIQSGSSFTFDIPNGSYQPFFYYGTGWNPEKFMKASECGEIKGGFVSNEAFGKDSPQTLNNQILEYTLILQHDGNFKTQPSNAEEAF